MTLLGIFIKIFWLAITYTVQKLTFFVVQHFHFSKNSLFCLIYCLILSDKIRRKFVQMKKCHRTCEWLDNDLAVLRVKLEQIGRC